MLTIIILHRRALCLGGGGELTERFVDADAEEGEVVVDRVGGAELTQGGGKLFHGQAVVGLALEQAERTRHVAHVHI